MDTKAVIRILSKEYSIDLSSFTPEAREEILALRDKNLDIKELLLLFLGQIQKNAKLNNEIKEILFKLDAGK